MKIGEGTVVFLTGGGSGLGEAALRMLLSKGASVACLDVSEEKL